MNKILVIVILLLALSQVAFVGMQEEAPAFELPEVFAIALEGFLTYWIVNGVANQFPKLKGAAIKLVAALVAGLLVILTDLVNLAVPPTFFALATELFIYLATLLIAFGTKHVEQKLRIAIAAKSP